jgi:hypothetical protein
MARHFDGTDWFVSHSATVGSTIDLVRQHIRLAWRYLLGDQRRLSKYLHSRERVDIVNFTFWQMPIGTIPVILVERTFDTSAIEWSPTFVACAIIFGIGAQGLRMHI